MIWSAPARSGRFSTCRLPGGIKSCRFSTDTFRWLDDSFHTVRSRPEPVSERQMLLQVILLLISSLALSQDSAVKRDNSPKPYEDVEAYKVYSAILPTGSVWQVHKAKTL